MADNKILVFDMDGTIADLYGIKGWLSDIENESLRPYEIAKPLYNMDRLNNILNALIEKGYRVVVVSWLSMNGSKEYDKKVRRVKREWLDKHDFPYNELHIIKYGTTKANATRKYGYGQTLFDDNTKICKGWSLGKAVNANSNILEYLEGLL